MERFDILIAGAGVTGCMIARELSRYQLTVCLLDKANDVATGATKANSGIVHGGFDPEPDTLKAKLNVEGSEMMEQVAKELGVKYKRNGSLVIGFNEEDEKSFDYYVGPSAKEEQEVIRPNTILSIIFGLFKELFALLFG